MPPWQAVGLFCEDIREEKSGQDTLVGILPDNVNLTKIPGVIPKLCLYVRVHVDLEADITAIVASLRFPDGTEQSLGSFDSDFIKKTQKEAREKGAPFAGFIAKGIGGPLNVSVPGQILAIAKIDNEEVVCAFVNIQKSS